MKPVHWNDIRDEISGLLETRERGHLFAVLDELAKELDSNGVEPVLYVDERPFGEPILDEALKSIDTMDSSNRLKTQMHSSGKFPRELAYAPIPLGLILENAVEIFDPRNIRKPYSEIQDAPMVHHAPLKLLFAGDFFGVFETLDYLSSAEAKSHDPWTMVAGARSVQVTFSLARDMTSSLSAALELFGLDYDPTDGDLKSATDHEILWQLASALAPAWKVRYALFPEHWLYEESVSESVRVRFEHYFFDLGWHQAQPLMIFAITGKGASRKQPWVSMRPNMANLLLICSSSTAASSHVCLICVLRSQARRVIRLSSCFPLPNYWPSSCCWSIFTQRDPPAPRNVIHGAILRSSCPAIWTRRQVPAISAFSETISRS